MWQITANYATPAHALHTTLHLHTAKTFKVYFHPKGDEFWLPEENHQRRKFNYVCVCQREKKVKKKNDISLKTGL
jgi:hypothetical protein